MCKPLEVKVSLFHITKPEHCQVDFWTSYCRAMRGGQEVVLTNSAESKEKLKVKVREEMAGLRMKQVPVFDEPQLEVREINGRSRNKTPIEYSTGIAPI